MMRPAPASLLGLATFAVLSLGACAGTWRDGTAAESSGLTPVQFPDIPVPDGMTLQTELNESHSIEVGSFRYGDFYYYGTIPVQDVADYLERRMPLHKWEKVAEQRGEGRVEQSYRRATQTVRCEVFEDPAGVVRMRVHVRTSG